MNYQYKYNKYIEKSNDIILKSLFTELVKAKISKRIDQLIVNKDVINNDNPSIQEIIFNDISYILFKTKNDIKYFLIDKYGSLINYYNPENDNEQLKKIADIEKIIKDKEISNLVNPEFEQIIENQIYLGLFYSNQYIIDLLELDPLFKLNIFTRTIVEMVLEKLKR